MSDLHFDSPECDTGLLKRHLNEARDRGALVFIRGDIFDVMQSRHDKRRSLSHLKPAHKTDDYLTAVLDEFTAFIMPYRECIGAISPGNHESAIRRECNIDLLRLLANRLEVPLQTYAGFTQFTICPHGKTAAQATMYHHHGFGGDSFATKAMGHANRMALDVQGADIYHSGHTHTNWIHRAEYLFCNSDGTVVPKSALHIKTAGYKPSRRSGNSWETERNHGVKGSGAAWVEITAARDRTGGVDHCRIITKASEA